MAQTGNGGLGYFHMERNTKVMSAEHYENYSVLMSVYYKEKPEYLRQAMDSMIHQTVPTDDFVLVCDGPLTADLDAVIAEKQQELGTILNVVRLEKNGGLGNALNEGIKHCRHELIARMDSDDISYPDRCEKQMKLFEKHPEYDVISGTVVEFNEKQKKSKIQKKVPENQREILNYSKRRNPVNHPCVMYKKDAVIKVGNYQTFFYLEDYFLWIRMLKNGYIFYNTPEVLLNMRTDDNLYERRGGIQYFKTIAKLRKYMYKENFINLLEFIVYSILQLIVCLIPNKLRKIIYMFFLRSKE